jgi:AhpD family alkylhydroperoxidase
MPKNSMVRSVLALVAIVLSGLALLASAADSNSDPVTSNDAAFMATFSSQYKLAWGNGAIPAKYKELTGITVSVVLRCEPCLTHHINMAVRAKAGRSEVTEAMRLGLVAGGSAGLPVMQTGYTTLDAVLPPS